MWQVHSFKAIAISNLKILVFIVGFWVDTFVEENLVIIRWQKNTHLYNIIYDDIVLKQPEHELDLKKNEAYGPIR